MEKPIKLIGSQLQLTTVFIEHRLRKDVILFRYQLGRISSRISVDAYQPNNLKDVTQGRWRPSWKGGYCRNLV